MINFEIALMRGFLGRAGGGRQGLCDYEGHLIVRSLGMHWLWAVSILKTYLCFVLATCGCSGPCRGGGQAATIMTKFLYNYDKVFYNYDKVLL